MTALIASPRIREFDDDGAPLSGGKLYSYEPGTTTPKALYSDDGLSSALSNPVVADSAGRFAAMFADAGLYKLRLETSSGALVWEVDDYDPGLGVEAAALPISAGGTGATTAAAARTALGAASTASVSSVAADLAAAQATIDGGVNGSGDFGALAKEDTVTAQLLDDDFGSIRIDDGAAESTSTTFVNTSTTIPNDDTIPTSSEGTQIFSITYTPVRSDSRLFLEMELHLGSSSGAAPVAIAVFTTASASAQKTAGARIENTAGPVTFRYKIELSNWGTSSDTVSVRMGRAGSSGGFPQLNGASGSRMFGGTLQSYARIEEWIATPVA